MRKIIYSFAVVLLALTSCTKNDRQFFETKQMAYFANATEDSYSYNLSLLSQKEDTAEYTFPIMLLGQQSETVLKYKVEVVTDSTTAVVGVHYNALPEYFEFPANSSVANMPITFINTDESLAETPVSLYLRIVDSEDIDAAYSDRIEYKILTSMFLREPEGDPNPTYTGDISVYYTDGYYFNYLFGTYSQTKHKLIIEMVGHDFWDNKNEDGSDPTIYSQLVYYKLYARRLYKYLIENELYDEYGNIMSGKNV